jgi:hypothetical protein
MFLNSAYSEIYATQTKSSDIIYFIIFIYVVHPLPKFESEVSSGREAEDVESAVDKCG